MPTNTLDSILNVVVPSVAFIFLGFVIYKGFKEPIDDFIGWIKGLFVKEPQYGGGYQNQSNYGGNSRGKKNPFGFDSSDISYR